MNKMLKIELYKIYKRKSVIVTLFIMLAINIFYFLFFSYWWNDIYILNEKSEVCSLKGNEAIQYDKKIGEYFEGVLDEKKIAEINRVTNSFKDKYSGCSEDEISLLMNKFRSLNALAERINSQEQDSVLNGIKIGYCTGWSKFTVNFPNVITFCMALILIVGIANIFSAERDAKMLYIIGASEFGRTKLVTAKFKAMYIYSMVNYTMFYAANILLYGLIYGFEGADCNIQSSLIFVNSDYQITFGELAILMYFSGIISCLALGSIILSVSTIVKKSGSAITCSLLVVFAPLFFDLSDVMPLLQKIIELTPAYMLNIKEVFMDTKMYFGYKMHILLGCAASVAIILIIRGMVSKYLKKNDAWDL